MTDTWTTGPAAAPETANTEQQFEDWAWNDDGAGDTVPFDPETGEVFDTVTTQPATQPAAAPQPAPQAATTAAAAPKPAPRRRRPQSAAQPAAATAAAKPATGVIEQGATGWDDLANRLAATVKDELLQLVALNPVAAPAQELTARDIAAAFASDPVLAAEAFNQLIQNHKGQVQQEWIQAFSGASNPGTGTAFIRFIAGQLPAF